MENEENDNNDFFENLLNFNNKLESIEKKRAYNKNMNKQRAANYYHSNKNNPEFRQRRLLADKAYREKKRRAREYELSAATLNIPLEEEILSINTKLLTPPQQVTETPQQSFLPPPQQPMFYLSPPQQSFLPPPQQSFLPPPQQSFLPPPQQPMFYLPPPQQSFLPPPQQPMFFLQPHQQPLVNTSTINQFTNSNEKSKRLAAAIAATRAARGLPPYKGGKTKRVLRGNKKH